VGEVSDISREPSAPSPPPLLLGPMLCIYRVFRKANVYANVSKDIFMFYSYAYVNTRRLERTETDQKWEVT